MFLHLGGDIIVPKKEVVAILNVQLMKKNETNKEFMSLASEEGFVLNISDGGQTKSIIITSKNVYLSPISTGTLKKRSLGIEKDF